MAGSERTKQERSDAGRKRRIQKEQDDVDRSTPQSKDEKKERGVQADNGYIAGIVLPVTGSVDAI